MRQVRRLHFPRVVFLAVTALALVLAPWTGGGTAWAQWAPTVNGWQPLGISGGGGMFSPAISPADPDLMMINCDMSGAYISRDGGYTWSLIDYRQLGSSTRCHPGFHPTNPDIIYAAHGWWSGLRVSNDAGLTWTPMAGSPTSPVGEIEVASYDPTIILVGTSSGASLTRNGGSTWQTCSGPTGEGVGVFIEPVVGGALVAATTQGVWRSDDGGTTWNPKVSGLPSTQIRSFAAGGTGTAMRLYCIIPSWDDGGQFAGGVYRSVDRGQTWQSAMGEGINTVTGSTEPWGDGPIAQYMQVLTTNAQPNRVYTTNTSTGFWPPHHATVYRSDNAGDLWDDYFFPDPRAPGLGFPYNVTPNWLTATLNQNWPGAPIDAAICDSDADRVITVDSMRAYITYDGGTGWVSQFCAPPAGVTPAPGSPWLCNGLVVTTTWNYYIDPFQPDRHYICYTDIGFARSLDAGETWIWWESATRPPWTNTTYELAFDPTTPGKIWGAFSNIHDIPNNNIISGAHNSVGPGGVAVSTDFAETWTVVASGLPSAPATSIVVDPTSPAGNRTLYVGVFDYGVYKSTDDGLTWTQKNTGLGAADNMRVYRVVRHADGTLFALVTAKRNSSGTYLIGGAGLYRSRDGGDTWQSLTASLGLRWPKDFNVSPQSSDIIFLGVTDGWTWPNPSGQSGLYRTTDGGAHWERVAQEGPQHFGAYFHPDRPGWVYMTLTEGNPGHTLWLSRDNGNNWQALESFPFNNTQRVAFDPADPDTIYVTTFGASVLRGRAGENLPRFPDVLSDHWAYTEVEACAAAGIVGGYPDGLYHPDVVVTRDQMAVFIARALAGGDALVPTPPETATFPDVQPTGDEAWAYKYVEYCVDELIVGGYPEGDYRPLVELDRGQMAVFIARSMVPITERPTLSAYPTPTTESFPDVPNSGGTAWCFREVEYIHGLGIVNGYPEDGLYHHEVLVTRDQMAAFIARSFGL